MKALYPPIQEGNVSIPDQTWDATMRFSAAPSMVVTAPTGTSSTWDMMVLNTPGDVRGAIVVTGPAGTDFRSPDTPANSQVQVLYITPNSSRLTKSYGVAIDNSAVEQTGSYMNPGDVAAFRTVGRGVTIHCTASDLFNGGTVTAGQFCAPPKATNILASTAGELQLEAPADAPIISRTYFDIALEENGLIQMCPGAQTTEAKHGVFMPLRLLGPDQPFVRPALSADQRVTCTGSASPSLFSIAEHYIVETAIYESDIVIPTAAFVLQNSSEADQQSSSNYDSTQPWWTYASLDNANTEAIYDTAYDFCATGVSIFRDRKSVV